MSYDKQLFPDRPSRGELFDIAERWIERQRPMGVAEPKDVSPIIMTGAMIAPMMSIGYLLEGPVSKMIAERRSLRQVQHDDAMLTAEQYCRDLEPRKTIGELAAYIVAGGRPHSH